MERQVCGSKFNTDQTGLHTLQQPFKISVPKGQKLGKCSSPEEVRIAIVRAVSVFVPLVSHTLLVYSSLPPLRTSERVVLLKLRSESEWVGEENFPLATAF